MQKGRLSWNIPQNNVLLFTLGHFGTDWAQGGIPALLPLFYRGLPSFLSGSSGHHLCKYCPRLSVTQPLIGYYSDRASLPYLVPLGVFLCGFSLSAMAFTQNYWFILFLAMLSGLGSSLFHPEAARLVNGISGAQKARRWGLFLSVAMRALPSVPWQQGSVPISLASRVSSFTPWSISLRLSS